MDWAKRTPKRSYNILYNKLSGSLVTFQKFREIEQVPEYKEAYLGIEKKILELAEKVRSEKNIKWERPYAQNYPQSLQKENKVIKLVSS